MHADGSWPSFHAVGGKVPADVRISQIMSSALRIDQVRRLLGVLLNQKLMIWNYVHVTGIGVMHSPS